MRCHRAFTLIELLTILVIIAIIVTIAIPNLLGSRVEANETAAMATVRTVVQAQLAFVARQDADLNANGAGEFGTFGEMSGNIAVRAANGGTKLLEPGTINPSFRAISPIGEMFRSGYYYRIYLPGTGGSGVIELPGGGADTAIDADLAENTWCVYAWPQKFGTTGRKTFFASQNGDILYTEDANYSGPGAAIVPGAAFAVPGVATSILGHVAANQVGRDGNPWKAAGR